MANRKRHGRGQQPQRRRPNPRPTGARHEGSAQDQQLFQALRGAMRSDDPIDLLAMVSGMLEVTDPRRRDPFAGDEQHLSLADLVESLVGTPYAETTAALTVIRAFVPDEVMAARVGRELEGRRHPMPDWLT